jgi:hypothetical protein
MTGSWAAFFAMTGTSAASLTGLMFVVITLVQRQERLQSTMQDGVETFSSPNVVHFCIALLVSAILAAPWSERTAPEVLLVLAALYGLVYAARVLLRMARLGIGYLPDVEDWFWYAVFPLLVYVALLAGAVLLGIAAQRALYVVGGATVALVFVGIRNSWDTVTYITLQEARERSQR